MHGSKKVRTFASELRNKHIIDILILIFMTRNDVRVLKNNSYEDGYPQYLVILAKEIENYAADGTSYDYSLENEESTCWSDLESELENKYKGLVFGLENGNEICFDEWQSDTDALNGAKESNKIQEIRKFAADWLDEHVWHDDPLYWNYFDGSNWKSVLLYSESEEVSDNLDYELLDEDDDEAKKVLAAYDRAEDASREWENGYSTYEDEETGLTVRFSQWSGHASMADIF